MTEYQLVALRFDQVIKRNGEGRPIEVVKHRTGAVISGLDRSEAERLMKAGAIVPIDEDADAEREAVEAVNAGLAEAERIKAWLSAETQWTEEQAAKTAAQPPAAQPLVRPKAASTKPLWEAYATERGIDVTGLDKDEIIAAVDALDAK